MAETMEKKQVDVGITPVRSHSNSNSEHEHEHEWQTGFQRRFPWLSLAALVLMLTSAAGAVAVLFCSNGKTEGQWAHHAKIKPSVLLAGINAVFNVCLGILISKAVAIAWWRKVLMGKTVQELHQTWSFYDSTLELARGVGKWNTVAVAALAAKLAIMDGILLQRATSTYSDVDVEAREKNITGGIVTRLPEGYSGYYSGKTGVVGSLTPDFASIVRLWSTAPGQIYDSSFYRAADHPGDFGLLSQTCIGACGLSIPAAGFSIQCQTSPETIDYGMEAATYMASHIIRSPDYPILAANFSLVLPTEEQLYTTIRMDLQYMNSEYGNSTNENSTIGSCPGTFKRKVCALRPAVVTYPITVIGSKSIANQKGQTAGGSAPGVIMAADNADVLTKWGQSQVEDFSDTARQLPGYIVGAYTDILEQRPSPNAPTTLGGVALALNNLFSASANVTWSDVAGWTQSQSGNFAQTWLPALSDTEQSCNYTIPDPTAYLLRQINSIMLTASLYAASQNESIWFNPPNFTATQTTDTIYYETHTLFLWLALASMLLCILCVVPAYYGFWQLGRKVSLGPVEIAAAFQAPVLAHPELRSGEVERVLESVGGREVRYGIFSSEEGGEVRLVVGNSTAVEGVEMRKLGKFGV